jgi:hypothetical protein
MKGRLTLMAAPKSDGARARDIADDAKPLTRTLSPPGETGNAPGPELIV